MYDEEEKSDYWSERKETNNKFEEIVKQILQTNKITRDELMSRIKKKQESL